MKKTKKPIALLLVLLLFLSLMPVGALASDDAEPTEEEEVLEVLPVEEGVLPPAEEAEGEQLPEDGSETPGPAEENGEVPTEEEDDEEVTPMAEPEDEPGGEEDEELEIQADDPDVPPGLIYEIHDGTVTITRSNGRELPAELVIPATIEGYPVTAIGYWAFNSDNAVTSISIPESVTSIDGAAFTGCRTLTEISVDPANQNYCSVDGVLYSKDKSTLIRFPGGRGGAYSILPGVEIIVDDAFCECPALTSVVIPDSVTVIGEDAFAACTALESVNIAYGVTEIGEAAFIDCKSLTSIVIPGSVNCLESFTFEGCKKLQNVEIQHGVTAIWDSCFASCSALKSITIPKSVDDIGFHAFDSCIGLESITIPNSVTRINSGVFHNCTALKTVYYLGTQEEFNRIVIDTYNEGLQNAHLICLYAEDIPMISLDREYVVVEKNRMVIVRLASPDPIPEGSSLSWSLDDAEIAEIDQSFERSVVVVGQKEGTAWVTATLRCTEKEYSARCRIDVTKGEVPPEVESVSLTSGKATVEVLRTDYTRISVVPNLNQNAFGIATLDPDYSLPGSYGGAYAIDSAEFENEEAAGYFKLRVVDDRTLEIVPTEAALQAADSGSKALKGSYKSKINLIINSSPFTTTGPLTLTVKKSQPKLTAKAVKLNSFMKDEKELSITGGTVTKITAIESPVPEWLITPAVGASPADLTFRYDGPIRSDAPKSQKATVKLTVQAEGWAVLRTVSVPVTAAPVQPKVTFSTKTVTLNPKDHACSVCFTVSPAEYMTAGCVDFENSTITENGQPVGSGVLWFSGESTTDTAGNAVFELMFGTGSDFGSMQKERTFKFNLDVGGKKFPLTIKTLPESKAELSITAKAKGVIDTAIPNSPVTLDITLKGNSYIDPRLLSNSYPGAICIVEINRTKDGATEYVKGFGGVPWTENVDSSHARFTLRQENLETSSKPLDLSYTYMAKLKVTYNGSHSAAAEAVVTIPVKSSAPAKVQLSVTAKAKGAIDVIRPDTTVVLTPMVKNGYGIELKTDPEHLLFFRKDGKNYVKLSEHQNPFTAELNETGTGIVIRLKPGTGVNHKTDKFAVKLLVEDETTPGRTAETKTYTALPLTMGKAKITQSTKAMTFLKKDIHSSGNITLGTENPAHKITGVTITNDKQGLYELQEVGSGQYVISCTDRMTLKTAKNTTLKLAVTLAGNNSGKPNVTVSVKVTWK